MDNIREIDKHFMLLFKDLKIVPDAFNPKTKDGEDNYVCFIGKQAVSKNTVIRLLKQYQDDIMEMLLKGDK